MRQSTATDSQRSFAFTGIGWLLRIAAMAVFVLALHQTLVDAATLTFDPQFSSGVNVGGGGVWDGSTSNWFNGSADTNWNNLNTNADMAAFAGSTGGAVTLDAGGIFVNSLNFATTGYTLSGGGLTLTGTGNTINVGSGLTASIGSVIGDSGQGFALTGAGTLVLTGQNTYTGATTLAGGVLTLDYSSSSITSNIINSVSSLDLNGGALNINGGVSAVTQNFAGVNAQTGSETLTFNAGTGSLNVNLGTLTRNAGAVVDFSTAGTVALTSGHGNISATTSGITALGGGFVYNESGFAASLSTGLIGAATINTAAASNWSKNSPTTTIFDNSKDTTATNALAPTNIAIGGLVFDGTAGGINAITIQNTLTINDGAGVGMVVVTPTGGAQATLSGGVLLAPNELIIANYATSGGLVFGATAGIGNGNAMSLTMAGPGKTTIKGAMNFTGGMTVDSGATVVTGVITQTGGITVNGGTLTLDSTIANTYTGGTMLNGGTVQVFVPDGTSSLTAQLGTGTVTFNGGALSVIQNVASVSNAIFVTSHGGLLTSNGQNSFFTGAFTGGPGGTLTLASQFYASSATITVTGSMTNAQFNLAITDGTEVSLGGAKSNTALGTGLLSIYGNSYSTVGFLATQTAGDVLVNNVNIQNGGFGRISLSGSSLTISGQISGGTFVTSANAGETLTLANTNNSYASSILLGTGNISILSDGSLGAVPTSSTTPNITFTASAPFLAFGANNITVNANRTISIASGVSAGFNSFTNSGTIAGSITGNAVTITGSGTINFTGQNSYSGGTTIGSGTLATGSTSALGTGGVAFGLGTNPTLALNGLAIGVPSITSSAGVGVINNGSNATQGSLTVNGSTASVYGGVIGGAGNDANLVLNVNTTAGAALTLTGNSNSYTGGTNVNGGMLVLANSSAAGTALGSGATMVASGAVLASSGAAVGGGGNGLTINGGATLSLGLGAVGSLALGGDLIGNGSAGNNAQFNYALGGTPDASTITLGGNLNLTNSTLNITNASVGTYDLVHFGSDTGNSSFSAVTGINLGTFTYSETIVGQTLELIITNAAQTLTWSGGSLSNGAPIDGTGTWSSTSGATNFSTGATNTAWADDNIAIFGSSNPSGPFTVTLGSNITAGSITFNAGNNYTIAPDAGGLFGLTVSSGIVVNGSATISAPVTLGGGQTWTVATGQTLVASSTVSEAVAGSLLTVGGGGTLRLSGANAYSGGTVVNAGTVQINSDASLGASTGAVTLGLATLEVQSPGNTLATSRTINLTDPASTIWVDANTTYAVSSGISGVGTLNVSGPGTLSLSGVNGYAGGTNLNAGTLSIGADSALGQQGTTLTFNGGALSSPSGLTLTTSGAARPIFVGSAGGTIDVTNGNVTVAGAISGNSAGTLNITGSGAHTLWLSGNDSNFTGTFSVGPSTLLSLTYSSGTTASIDAKILLSGTSTTSAGELSLRSTNLTVAASTGAAIFLNGVGAINASNTNTYTVSAPIANATGASTGTLYLLQGSSGTGQIALSGTNTYNGGTFIQGGTVIANNSANSALGTGVVTFIGSVATTLDVFGKGLAIGGISSGAGSYTITNSKATAATITVNGNVSTTYAGVISDGAGKIGLDVALTPGTTFALTGNNNYSGGTTISSGIVQINSSTGLGNTSGAVTIGGGTLELLSGTVNTTRNFFLSSSTSTIQVDGSSTYSLGGVIADSSAAATGTLNVTGSGTLVLAGNNTYSNGTNINGGTVIIANTTGSAFGTGAVIVGSGATLANNGSAGAIAGLVTINSGGVLAGGSAASSVLNLAGGLTLNSGSMLSMSVGGGVFNLNGSSTLTLNTGTETVSVSGNIAAPGTFVLLSGAGAISGGGSLSLNMTNLVTNGFNVSLQTITASGIIELIASSGSTGNLVWNGASGQPWDVGQSTNWLDNGTPATYADGNTVTFTDTGAGSVVITSSGVLPASVVVNNSAGNAYTFSGGGIGGSASLTKLGTGTLELDNANNFTGGTTVSGGLLVIGATGSLSTSANVTLTDTAATTFANVGQQLGAVTNSSSAASALSFSANTGTITISQLAGTGATSFASNANITTLSGGSVSVAGVATISTVSGVTTALSLGGATGSIASLDGTGDVTLSGTTLAVNGGSFGGTFHNGVSAGELNISGGTFTFNGADNMTGGIDILSTGTLSAGTQGALGANLGQGEMLNLNGGTLHVTSSMDDRNASVLFSSGGVIDIDSGATLTLTGANINGSLSQIGDGTLFIIGGYGGTTTVGDGGTLKGDPTTTGNVTLGNGATLEFTTAGLYSGNVSVDAGGTATIKDDATGALTLTGTITKPNTATLNFTGGTIYLDGVIQGTGGHADVGIYNTNMFIQMQQNYDGPTTISGGAVVTLSVSNGLPPSTTLNLGSTSDNTSGQLDLAGHTQTIAGLVAWGSGTTNEVTSSVAGGALYTDIATGSDSFSGSLTGHMSLFNEGAGTFMLSGTSNSYDGATNIDAGTLQLGANNALPTSTAVTVASGATLDLNGHTQSITSLAGDSSSTVISSGASTLSVSPTSATSYVFAGAITGKVNFALSGVPGSSQVLSGTSDYQGTTSVNSGALLVNGSITGTGGAVTVNAGGTLGGTGTIDRDIVVAQNATIAPGPSVAADVGQLATSGSLTINGTYEWDLKTATSPSNTAQASAGTAYDQITLTSGSSLHLGANSTLGLEFLGSTAPTHNAFWNQTETWSILHMTSGSFADAGSLGTFQALDNSAYASFGDGAGFSLTYGADDVLLTWNPGTAVPEPGTLLLSALSTLGLGGLRWRKRRSAQQRTATT